jgi:hypothetical protein
VPTTSESASEAPNTPSGEVVQIQPNPQLASGLAPNAPLLVPQPSVSVTPTVLASSELIEFATRAASATAFMDSRIQEETYLAADKRQVISVKGSPLSAKFEYSLETSTISSLIIAFELDGQTYKTYPYSYSVSKNGFGSVAAVGQLGYFIDTKSRVVTENPLQSAKFELILQLDGSGKAVNAELKLTN